MMKYFVLNPKGDDVGTLLIQTRFGICNPNEGAINLSCNASVIPPIYPTPGFPGGITYIFFRIGRTYLGPPGGGGFRSTLAGIYGAFWIQF
jgi:hypothetical protein